MKKSLSVRNQIRSPEIPSSPHVRLWVELELRRDGFIRAQKIQWTRASKKKI